MQDLKSLVDISAEAGTIATLIYHPDYLLVDNNLREKFFYSLENQILYWTISKCVESGITSSLDALSLQNMIGSHPGVQRAAERCGLTNLHEYISFARSAARGTFAEYKVLANTVVMYAFRRELCTLSGEIGRECFNMSLSLDDLNDYVNNGINHIAERFIFNSDTIQLGEKIDDIWSEIENERNDDGTVGIPSKIPSLNEFFTFGKGELTLVAGPTGRGKSSYFLAETCNALKNGVSMVVFDTELTDKVYLPRLLACLSGVPVKSIKSGQYTNDEKARIDKAKEWVKSHDLVHQFQPTFNKLEIEQICRKWLNKDKLDFLVYDYIKPTEKYGAAEISQSMGLMADFLKSISGNMKIPVLGGLQLNTLTGNVADSMKPERYADVLMYWKPKSLERQQKDGGACGNFMIQVVKNRNGSIHDINNEDDFIDISFRGDYMEIKEAKQHKSDFIL